MIDQKGYWKQYSSQNKERIREKQRLYREMNKENIREKMKLYRQKYPERIKKYNLKYILKNKEKISKKNKEWYERNKEWYAQYRLEYYPYRKIVNSESRCELCDTNQDLMVHHRDKNRQNNERNNLKIVCRGCHAKIHIKDFLYVRGRWISSKIPFCVTAK